MHADPSHRAVIWRREEQYFGQIPELGILEQDADLATLWGKLELQTAQVRARFQEAGIAQEFPGPRPVDVVTVDRPTRRFLVRTAGVTAAILLCIWALGGQLYLATGHLAKSLGREFSTRNVIQRWVAGLEGMPEDKRAESRERLRALALALRPYAEELRPLFADLGASIETAAPPPPRRR
jgi:hypothetical protein